MKALQLTRPRSFAAIQVPVPTLGSDWLDRILVHTRCVSMCAGNIGFLVGGKRFASYPLLAGAPIHECVGQVTESVSDRFQSGDWVVALPEGDLGLTEFFVAQATKAVRLPLELVGRDTGCLVQPLSTLANAVDRLQAIKGTSVAVTGLGSMGLLLCWLLRKRGAGRIIGIDPVPYRCHVAEGLGVAQTWAIRRTRLTITYSSSQDGKP